MWKLVRGFAPAKVEIFDFGGRVHWLRWNFTRPSGPACPSAEPNLNFMWSVKRVAPTGENADFLKYRQDCCLAVNMQLVTRQSHECHESHESYVYRPSGTKLMVFWSRRGDECSLDRSSLVLVSLIEWLLRRHYVVSKWPQQIILLPVIRTRRKHMTIIL